MGRPEKPIDPQDGPIARFAYALRKLRDEAGAPGYRSMARRAGYSAATLSQAAGGERLPTLLVALAYVRACHGDTEEWRHRWEQADAEIAAVPRPPEEDGEPPYRGLERFEPGDAELFFGREETTVRLEEMVRRHRLSVVVGASGSGKSSLLRAGLIPRLRRPDQDAHQRPSAVRVLTPGVQPMGRADLLTPAEGRGDTWVLVDQFEELFTLCTSPDDRAAFLERLLAARESGSRLRVVLALRADFFGRCTENHALAAALNEATLLVGPMNTEQLRATIVRPAQMRGLNVERDLTARILEEVTDEPGALPLMSHALLETWRRRRGHILTIQAYEAAGGLRGAIARTAEDAYHQLTPSQTTLARRILLRLIAPGEGTAPDTRRPVDRVEFTTTDTTTDPDGVLQRLAAARLVTLDDETVDLAHEALITAWPRLHGWIESNRERLRRHRRLTDAARNWQDRGRDTGALLRGTELTEAEGAFKTPDQQDELTQLERDFLHQSTRADQRRSRRARSVTAALATLLVLALLAAASAYQQRNDAEDQRLRAVTARQQAQSRQLATQSDTLLQTNPDLASLLAVQAYRTSPTTEASASLYTAAALPLKRRLTATKSTASDQTRDVSVAFSADGRFLVTGGKDGTVRLWDPATGRARVTVTGIKGPVSSVGFTPDGRTLLVGGDRGTVWAKDTSTGSARAMFINRQEDQVSALFSPDGRTLAQGDSRGTVRVWDLGTGQARTTLAGQKVASMTFSPDGRTLATSDFDNRVRLSDARSGRIRTTLADRDEEVASLAFSRDGQTLVTRSIEGTVRVWDPATGRARITITGRSDGGANVVAVSPDGRTVATSESGSVRLWDTKTGRTLTTLSGHKGQVTSLAFNYDGHSLVTGGEDGTARLWDMRTGRTLTREAVVHMAFSRDGDTLATGSDNGSVRLKDTKTGRTRTTLTGPTSRQGEEPLVAFSRDGRILASANVVGNRTQVQSWDIKSGRTRITRSDTGSLDPLAFAPNGRTLASGSGASGRVRLWDTRTGRIHATLTGHGGYVGAAVFSSDGRTVATSSSDETVRLWDTKTGRTRAILPSQEVRLPNAFSPDGRALAISSPNGTVSLHNPATGGIRATLTGHKDFVRSAVFSPDGRTLATGSDDGTVRLWDTRTGRTRATLTDHNGEVDSVVFSPDGRTLASSSAKEVHLWDVGSPDQAAALREVCHAVGRDLTAEERSTYLPNSSSGPVCP